MRKHGNKIILAAVCAAAVAVDQLSKFAVRAFMESRAGEELVLIPGFLSIVHSFNTGVAFGMFRGMPVFLHLLPFIAVVILLVIFYRTVERPGVMWAVSLGLILAGALGNQIDRLFFGRVFDFIDAYIGSAHWPTFNAADSFIVIGVFLFAIMVFRGGFDG